MTDPLNITLQQKLQLHTELMPGDPRLRHLNIASLVVAPTKTVPYTVLQFTIDDKVIRVPFDKQPDAILLQPEGFLIARLFMALPTLIVWAVQNGLAGLGAFMYTQTPEDAQPARESDWVMFSLISLNGTVPA